MAQNPTGASCPASGRLTAGCAGERRQATDPQRAGADVVDLRRVGRAQRSGAWRCRQHEDRAGLAAPRAGRGPAPRSCARRPRGPALTEAAAANRSATSAPKHPGMRGDPRTMLLPRLVRLDGRGMRRTIPRGSPRPDRPVPPGAAPQRPQERPRAWRIALASAAPPAARPPAAGAPGSPRIGNARSGHGGDGLPGARCHVGHGIRDPGRGFRQQHPRDRRAGRDVAGEPADRVEGWRERQDAVGWRPRRATGGSRQVPGRPRAPGSTRQCRYRARSLPARARRQRPARSRSRRRAGQERQG